MITEKDLQEAIAECQGQRNPNANTCIKLAAFLTIQRELFGQDSQGIRFDTLNSFSPGPEQAEKETHTHIGNYGGTDFLAAIEGKNIQDVCLIMDELMEAMQVLQPRIYDSVMRKIQNI